jgi:copper chaperone CopZ
MQHRIKAQNIKCDGCVAAVKEALQEVPGVERVVVEKAGGWVTVDASGEVTRSQLTE